MRRAIVLSLSTCSNRSPSPLSLISHCLSLCCFRVTASDVQTPHYACTDNSYSVVDAPSLCFAILMSFHRHSLRNFLPLHIDEVSGPTLWYCRDSHGAVSLQFLWCPTASPHEQLDEVSGRQHSAEWVLGGGFLQLLSAVQSVLLGRPATSCGCVAPQSLYSLPRNSGITL